MEKTNKEKKDDGLKITKITLKMPELMEERIAPDAPTFPTHKCNGPSDVC